MRHIMIDIETFGTRPGAAIRSIGAVVFGFPDGDNGHPFVARSGGFYANITRVSCEQVGLRVEPETEDWWRRQSIEA